MDFLEEDVIPGDRELKQRNPAFVRKMPDKGDLISPHNYLDLLFRLLREDAIADLRNGVVLMESIVNMRLSLKERRMRIRDTNIKLHENLSIDGLEVIDGSSCIQFRLPTDKKRFLDWRICKKLLPGSLVVLSPDNFRTLYIGLLLNSDARERNKTHQKYGYVAVNVEIIKSNP